MLTIALIDKNSVSRTEVSYLLNENFNNICLQLADTADSFCQSYPESNPDLIILTFENVTSSQNMDAVIAISSYYKRTTIVVQDENPDPVLIVSYLRGNVKGYISRETGNVEIVDCVKLVLEGKRYVGFDLMEKLLKNLTSKTRPLKEQLSLTFKQYEIANYLAEGMEIATIAKKLGKKPADIYTVKLNIYKKLKVTDSSKLKALVSTITLKI